MQHILYIFLAILLWGSSPNSPSSPRNTPIQQTVSAGHDLTISYDIEITGKRRSSGIGETYNGGVKTVFMKDGMARVRMVSLMRMQDIFMHQAAAAGRRIALVKESGKNKYISYLTQEEWKQYNLKYADVSCHLLKDTAVILKRVCKKALVHLKDGRIITAYYSDQTRRPEFSEIEPAFACVPGLVLKYEYKSKRGTILYTATSISHDAIDPSTLAVPQTGYVNKKYTPSASAQ